MKTIRWTKGAVKGVIESFKALKSISSCTNEEFCKGFRKMIEALYGKDSIDYLVKKMMKASGRVNACGAEWFIICTSKAAGNFMRGMLVW